MFCGVTNGIIDYDYSISTLYKASSSSLNKMSNCELICLLTHRKPDYFNYHCLYK